MAERIESGTDPTSADLSGVSNVLVQSPSIGGGKREVCNGLLNRAPPAATSVIGVGYTATPADWIDGYEAHAGGPPARGGFVSVGEAGPTPDRPAWTVESVDNPGDLTGVGIAVSDLLTEFGERSDTDSLVVCFDSITSLLQYADLQRAFQFLHVVTNRVASAGGIGHYHVDPEAHTQRDMATLKGLYDAVAEAGDDGIDVQR